MVKAILRVLTFGVLLSAAACSAEAEDESDGAETDADALTEVPPAYLPSAVQGMKWFDWFKTNSPDQYFSSGRSDVDPRAWPDRFDPARDPVFSHNAMAMPGVTPHEVLALLAGGRSDTYYPNSSAATDCDSHQPITLSLGREYCWKTFGTDFHVRIVELVDNEAESVIGWQCMSLGIECYHRWIMRPTSTGTLVTTEEIDRGPLTELSFFSRKLNPSLHAAHELWLTGIQKRLAR